MSLVLVGFKKIDKTNRIVLPTIARELIDINTDDLLELNIDRDKKAIIIKKVEKKEG